MCAHRNEFAMRNVTHRFEKHAFIMSCAYPVCLAVLLQNFTVLLTRHNPETDSNAHFIVQPKMGLKSHVVQSATHRRVRVSPSALPTCLTHPLCSDLPLLC